MTGAVKIYGLIDPRTQQLRYVGKTGKRRIKDRLFCHLGHARLPGQKRHVLAWISGLLSNGLRPEIFVIEEVPSGTDWKEAEQFWIAYFRSIGADLCNRSIGGDSGLGVRLTAAQRERKLKSVKRGPDHYNFGQRMKPHIKEALKVASAEFLNDEHAVGLWREKLRTRAHITAAHERLAKFRSDPDKYAAALQKSIEARKTPEVRGKIGAASRKNWSKNRDLIIASQNAGKGADFRAKQSANKKKLALSPDFHLYRYARARRKLSSADIVMIKQRLASGETQTAIARDFHVSLSSISDVKTGVRQTD
jgi:hypothetical protein